MGTEVEAFLGPLEGLKRWKEQLKSVVVFSLTHELGLAPVTEGLLQELRRRRLPAKASDEDLINSWGIEASKGSTIAYFTDYEFGNTGDEKAIVWTDQRPVPCKPRIDSALELLGVEPAPGKDRIETVGLSRYRKTHRWAAAAVLQEFETRKGFAGVVEALKHSSSDVREQAAGQLRAYGPEAEAAIPTLVEIAKTDSDYGARLGAASALGAMGAAAVPALRGLLAPGELQDRWGVIFALGKIGQAAAPAVPELAQILKTDTDQKQRQAAAETLGKIGADAASAIPALIDAMRDKDQFVRYHAVVALGAMGPAAPQAIPALKKALRDSYVEVCWAAVVSLGKISPREALPELIATLKTATSWSHRSEAAEALGKMGKDAQAAIPALIDALRDKDNFVRERAIESLGMMGPAAKEAVPALQQALKDPYKPARKAASKALERIQPPN